MKTRVVYHSQSGNTRKVAEAIAKAVNVTAEDIANGAELTDPVDLLFIGDGVYFGNMSKAARKYIDVLSGELIKNAVVFGTFGGVDKATGKMRDLLGKKGIKTGDVFSCKGKAWLMLNRKHPNDGDLRNAGEFARRIVQALSNA